MLTLSCLTSRYVCSVYTTTLKETTNFSHGTSSGRPDSTEKVILMTSRRTAKDPRYEPRLTPLLQVLLRCLCVIKKWDSASYEYTVFPVNLPK